MLILRGISRVKTRRGAVDRLALGECFEFSQLVTAHPIESLSRSPTGRKFASRVPRVGNNAERSVRADSRDPSSVETWGMPVECHGQSSRIKLPVLIGRG